MTIKLKNKNKIYKNHISFNLIYILLPQLFLSLTFFHISDFKKYPIAFIYFTHWRLLLQIRIKLFLFQTYLHLASTWKCNHKWEFYFHSLK